MGFFFPELYLADEPCIQYNGAFISRSRFEALGGSLTAKWYLSIRVTATGEKLGAYLTRQGLPIFAGRRPRNPRQRKRKSETQAGPAQPAAKAKPATTKPAPSPFAAAAATAAAAIVAGTGPAGPDAPPADGPQGGPERASCAADDGPITDTAADADLSEESDGEPDWLALAWRQHSNELDGLKSVGSGEAAAAAAAWAAAACTAAADADMQPSMAAAPAPAPSAAAAVQRPCTGGGSAGPGAAVPQSCAVEPPSAFSLQMFSSGCSSGGGVTGGPRLLSADSSSGFVGGRVSLPGRNSGSPTQPALLAGPLGSSEQGLLLSSGSLQTAQTLPWQPSRPLPASLSLSRQLSRHPSQQMEEPALRRPSISASVPFGVEGGAPCGLSGGAAALTRQPSRGDACTHGPGFSSSPAAAAGILPPGGARPYRRPPPPRLSQQGSFSDSVSCGVGWPTSPASPGAMGVGSAAGGLFGGGILMADLRARAAAAQAERTTEAPGSGPLLPAEAAMAPRRSSTGDRGTLAAPAAPFPASHAPAVASAVEHAPPPPVPAAAAPLAPAAAAVTTGGVHPHPHGGARHHSGGGSATVSTGACGGPGSPWGRAPCAVAAPLPQAPPPEPCAAYRGHPSACSQPPPQPAAQDSPALPAPGPFAPPHATAAQWAHRPAPCPAPYHVTQPGCEAQHEPSSGVVVVHHHHYHVVVVPPHHSNHPNHLNRPNHLHSAVLPSVAAAQRFSARSGSGGWDPAAMAPPSALPGGPYDRSSTTYDYVMYE
ncbi:hypothetical protein HYH03_016584 [Edaphochlamys debaryana]|uniref:Uncharacterized protein n=1 Tax=Edaphochlamys debaryana TaxID=47281 RepID=A0A836BQ03_9CHLO|nr:hypothetical protein HYH03_016584 [Edaphochlamys debaryana]|eukprot:KAG2484630.1 hypothetical protein HYH03_016584 [Edaphochlamys debaryana]